jgi:peptidyl-tRNA hydrolase, PTH2 family
VRAWTWNGQPKITLKCGSEKEMLELESKAIKLGIVAESICDAGRTQIPAGSRTVLSLGPDTSVRIDKVTGHLKLY